MDVHLRDLRYFVAVAEELSFTRAAERLHLSQPALSKQIRGLETTLRARLLDRDRRQVRLTRAGEALLANARILLHAWNDGAQAVAESAALDARVLRVGTLTSIGRSLYPSVLDHFAKRQPGWRVELRSFGWGDPSAGLRDRATDVAFVWLPADYDDLDYKTLVIERRFVAMSTKHPLARRSAVRFAEIVQDPVVALPPAAGALRDFWLAKEERGGVPARIVAEVTSVDEKLELVAAGEGIALLAEGNAVVYARPGVVCVPVTGLGPASLAIAWRRQNRTSAAMAFVDSCIDALNESTVDPTSRRYDR